MQHDSSSSLQVADKLQTCYDDIHQIIKEIKICQTLRKHPQLTNWIRNQSQPIEISAVFQFSFAIPRVCYPKLTRSWLDKNPISDYRQISGVFEEFTCESCKIQPTKHEKERPTRHDAADEVRNVGMTRQAAGH